MKKILILMTLFLCGAWAYTSWYWYTCHIKDMCTLSLGKNQAQERDTSRESSQSQDNAVRLSSENQQTEESSEILESEITEDEGQDIQSLSEDDVTAPSTVIPPQAVLVEDDSEDEIPEDTFLATDPISESETREEVPSQRPDTSTSSVRNICQNPLVGPLSLGANNKSDEVFALERFLIGRGLLSSSDGIFGNDVFEAVKAFQEEFRSEILTPWGINNPTGYVGRTTIQKIQALACN